MSSLDRRSFLKTTAAGLVSVSAARGRALPADEDPLGVRTEFPITKTQAYLNTASAGPLPKVVREAALEFADEKMLRPTPGRRHEVKELARVRFAELFGATPQEVAFLYSTSDGENIVAHGLDLQAGDNVVVDELHFITSFVLYRQLEKDKGIELRIVPHRMGRVPIEGFEARVDRRTRLVSVAWVSNRNGYRHDLPALADLAHRHGAFLYADTIQALGTFPTRLSQEGVDFAAGNSYKWLFAGYGVAPFFIREEHLDRIRPDRYGHLQVVEPLPDFHYRLHTTAKKFEYANLAYGPIYQLYAALEFIDNVGLSRIEEHGVALAGELRDGVARLGFEIWTPHQNPSPIVSFAHGQEPDKLARLLDKEGVVVTFSEGGTQVRASVALFNNRGDVQRLLAALAKIA
jgi:selenocysteine lyase/cysteine desulfurase